MQKNFFNMKNINDYWRNINKKIFFSFLLLFFLGIFFSFSSTSSLAGERLNKNFYFFFSKHLFYASFAIILMLFISFIDTKILKKIILPAFIISVTLLLLVPIIGIEVKGAKRWLNFIFFRLQPIELVKPCFVLMTASLLNFYKDKNINYFYALSLLVLTLIMTLLIYQPDIGQSILLFGTWLSIIFIAGVKISYIMILFLIFLLLAFILFAIFPEKFGYIFNRLLNFFDPKQGDSFQTDKALAAMKQGGIKGQGMGEGILKDSVPEAHTDYIIAVITEEFGSIISICVVLIFLYIAFNIIKHCLNDKNDYFNVSLIGLSSLLIFQTFIHIGVNTSLLPTTGMTLPFLSYGGSSLIGSAILAGVILNFTKVRYDNE